MELTEKQATQARETIETLFKEVEETGQTKFEVDSPNGEIGPELD